MGGLEVTKRADDDGGLDDSSEAAASEARTERMDVMGREGERAHATRVQAIIKAAKVGLHLS